MSKCDISLVLTKTDMHFSEFLRDAFIDFYSATWQNDYSLTWFLFPSFHYTDGTQLYLSFLPISINGISKWMTKHLFNFSDTEFLEIPARPSVHHNLNI